MANIGITGHRLFFNKDRITAGVDQALKHAERVFTGRLTLFSSLAEGADRLVVKRFLMHHAGEIIVPLPLPVGEYEKDFSSQASIVEFYDLLEKAQQVVQMPMAHTREEAYRAAGIYMLDHIDALVTLWDGQEARGIGGTGEIVEEARRRKLPISWVVCENGNRGTGSGNAQNLVIGRVTYENF